MLTINFVSYASPQSTRLGVLTGSCEHKLYSKHDERWKVNSIESSKTYRALLNREIADQVLLLNEPFFLTCRGAVKIDEVLT